MQCNLCGNTKNKLNWRTDQLLYVKCGNCGLIFQDPMPDKNQLELVYKNYYQCGEGASEKNFGYQDYEKERSPEIFQKNYLPWIKKYAFGRNTFLDFGCGSGNFIKALQSEGFKAEGVEFSREAFQLLSKKNIPFYHYDDIDKINKKYHCISMIDVPEHLFDPLGDLKKINSLTEQEGLVFIETVNSDDFFVKYFHKDK